MLIPAGVIQFRKKVDSFGQLARLVDARHNFPASTFWKKMMHQLILDFEMRNKKIYLFQELLKS